MENLLELRNVVKRFYIEGLIRRKYVTAVDGVSFTIPGEKPTTVSLVGESGSGKTTIARLILGFIKPTSGEILYKGKNIWKITGREWWNYRREVQAIFQDPYAPLNPFYKVKHALIEPIKKFKLANSQSEADKLAKNSVEDVGLRAEVLDKYPHQLSGGERQRIMIARAFAIRPKLVIADEPVSMVDASLRASILDLMNTLKEKYGTSFLYITHDLSTAYSISSSVLVIYLGTIVERGDCEAVIKNPKHPYMKMLIESVPIPDPKMRWRRKVKLKEESGESIQIKKGRLGCKFYDRCPEVMDICRSKAPPLVKVERNHWVACFLYGK